jgi:hypothetical protein
LLCVPSCFVPVRFLRFTGLSKNVLVRGLVHAVVLVVLLAIFYR